MFCIPLGSRITTLTSGDKQNETKPSALEVAGRALKGSGALVLVSLSSLWTCFVVFDSAALAGLQ